MTLAQMGVKLMIAGNIGQGAVNVMNNQGIDVLRGCSGGVKDVVEKDAGLKEILNNYFKGEFYENRITITYEPD